MLDLLTVVTYNAVINLAIAVIATVAWWRHPRQTDIVYWLVATWFMVFGAICMSMAEALPYHIMEFTGGTIYVAMTGFMRLGFKEFYGQPHRLREAFYVSGPIFIALALAELLDDPTPVRISLIYLGSAINLALGAEVLWRGKPGEQLPSGRLAAIVFASYAAADVLTAPLALLFPVQFVGRVPVSDWMAYTSMLLLIFNVLAFLMAMVLKLERSGEIQRQLAERDPLTGLLNRRMFLQEARRLAASGTTAIAVLDLDHFKAVNDTYGHKGGDDALIQFAERARHSLPAGAVFGRLGGEEFGICLPGHDADAALDVLDRFRDAVAREDIHSDDHRFGLTFSCGFAVMDDPARSLDAWMADADLGLYAAKNDGRNRIVAHRPGMMSPLLEARANGAVAASPEPPRLSA
ncbi:MAG: GGDEF domain-containing protein [Rhizobium sp.]|nr:GGDEF domain-containing protein [Rhizobium sp.]